MEKKKFKQYGRLNLNKLDFLLAIVCCVFALAALLLSLGISIADAGDYASFAFYDFGRGLGFVADATKYGQAAVVSTYVTVIFYASLVLLVLGSFYLAKKDKRERVPGLVAEFVSAIALAFAICFAYEYLHGSASGTVATFFPILMIVFAVIFFCLIVCSIYATFAENFDISLGKKTKEEEVRVEDVAVEEPVEELVEEVPVEEPTPVVEEEPEPEPVEEVSEEAPVEEVAKEEPVEEVTEEEPVEEPAPVIEEEPEPEPAEEPAEEEDEEEEADEEEESADPQSVSTEPDNPFAELGQRKKRIPFENMIARSDKQTRARYREIVAALREYDFNDRKSIPGETFSYKRTRLVYVTMVGTTLRVYFKLDPKEFENSPIPAKDASDKKKYEDIPMFLKVKSNLAVKRVIELARRVAEENNVPAR